MAKCSSCGAELFETSRFCPECGVPVNKDDPVQIAEILETKAENILEDIPEIKKIDNPTVTSGGCFELPEPPKILNRLGSPEASSLTEAAASDDLKEKDDDKSLKPVSETISEEKSEGATQAPPSPERKKSPVGIVIGVIALLAVGAGAFIFINKQDGDLPTNTDVVLTETAFDTQISIETEVETETVITSETTESISEEASAVTSAASETENTAAETAAEVSESMHQSDGTETSVENDVQPFIGQAVFTPEHRVAMGNAVSAEIMLSGKDLSPLQLKNATVIANFTSQAEGFTDCPVGIIIHINDDDISVSASSFNDNQAFFEFSQIIEAVSSAGYSTNEIDAIAFASMGAPIDVSNITVFNKN